MIRTFKKEKFQSPAKELSSTNFKQQDHQFQKRLLLINSSSPKNEVGESGGGRWESRNVFGRGGSNVDDVMWEKKDRIEKEGRE